MIVDLYPKDKEGVTGIISAVGKYAGTAARTALFVFETKEGEVIVLEFRGQYTGATVNASAEIMGGLLSEVPHKCFIKP